MSEPRLSMKDVARYATMEAGPLPLPSEVRALAREVQASRKLVAYLLTLPADDESGAWIAPDRARGYNSALARVRGMIEGHQ